MISKKATCGALFLALSLTLVFQPSSTAAPSVQTEGSVEPARLDIQQYMVTVQPLLPIVLIFSAPAMLRALRRHSHGRK